MLGCRYCQAVFAFLLLAGVASGQVVDPTVNLSTEAARAQTVSVLQFEAFTAKETAVKVALQQGWPLEGDTPDGNQFELIRLTESGPEYLTTTNANAALSANVTPIRNHAPYSVNGMGITIGEWDGGGVMSTHEEFQYRGISRVSIMDSSGTISHSTHVAGTLIAAGYDADALGMAPLAHVDSYDWDDDISEMALRAATAPNQSTRLYLSNHSYGLYAGWAWGSWSGHYDIHWHGTYGERESRIFGEYNGDASNCDGVCYSAPYYLPFFAAGNDRNDAGPEAGVNYRYYQNGAWRVGPYYPATGPYSDGYDDGGFDTILPASTAKNIMTVGAIDDAVNAGLRDPAAGAMSIFSAWGPADDGRIKPDCVANGVDVYSTIATTNTGYGLSSGTSMASPNACGAAALLIQYYERLFPDGDMRSSMLKGLLLHTADDMGNAGPDYVYGWGLVNAKAAADLILAHSSAPARHHMVSSYLDGSVTKNTYTVTCSGQEPLRVTLCWTDPAHVAQDGLDIDTPMLVNDLDLRVTRPRTTWYPYVLDRHDPAAPAITGDNRVDNIEQVYIATPVAGDYTVTVSHKDTLQGTPQYYSLLCSGNVSQAALNSVTSTATDGYYGLGDVIPITATFSEPVSVTGAPTLQLATGITNNRATYASGTGTATLVFNYIVAQGDLSADLDYASSSALSLNGGTITTASGGMNAKITLPAPGNAGSLGGSKAINIDGIEPTATVNSLRSISLTPQLTGTVSENLELTAVTVTVNGQTYPATVSLNTWTVTVTTPLPEGFYDVLVSATDIAGNVGHDATTNELEVNTSYLTVTAPNGGESFVRGSAMDIKWTSNGAGAKVKIKLFAGLTFQAWITSSTANDGLHTWVIPDTLPYGESYRIQIYSVDNFSLIDFSDAGFAVVPSPLTVTAPNGGEQWYPGTMRTITWTSKDPNITNVKLKLYKGSAFHAWISGGTPNNGSLNWRVPQSLPLGADYSVLIYDATNSANKDWSDAAFAVTTAPIQMNNPNGGERFLPGDPVSITWQSQPGAATTVKLKLFKAGVFSQWISAGTPNDGDLAWTIPAGTVIGSDYQIQIYSATDFSIVDYSDAAFAVSADRLRLTSPNRGEVWAPGSTHNILWNSAGTVGTSVKLKLFKNGAFNRWISGGTANDGQYAWLVPADVVAGNDYRIQIYSVTDFAIIDFGDGMFNITP